MNNKYCKKFAAKESGKSLWGCIRVSRFHVLGFNFTKIMKCTGTVKINSLPVAANRRVTTNGNIIIKGRWT